jgi:hypothetical protein
LAVGNATNVAPRYFKTISELEAFAYICNRLYHGLLLAMSAAEYAAQAAGSSAVSLNIRSVVGNTANVAPRCFKAISDIEVFGYTCNRPP